MFSSKQRYGGLSLFAFLLLDYTIRHQSEKVTPIISRYLWAALPKPTRPDGLSIAAAQKDGLDISDIAGLVDEDTPREKRISTSVVDQLACDLQKLGRNFQNLYDHCTKLLRFAFFLKLCDAESLRRDQRSTAHVDRGDPDENQ